MRFGLLFIAVFVLATICVQAQPTQATGTILIQGKLVKDAKGKPAVARKRFYLFRGGLAENKTLIDSIDAAEIVSRDCYYAKLNASACFLSWLQEENCETAFCRAIKKDDIGKVKEFKDAYDRGIKLYGPPARPELALSWVLDNMSQTLVSGFYFAQKTAIERILAKQQPLQSIMTTSTAAEASFPGLAVGDKAALYTVSTLIPVEVGGKSYVWTCEASIAPTGKVPPIILSTDPKARKNCVLKIRDLPACGTGKCQAL
jgi:hypothetical protein